MTVTINASTSSGLQIISDTSGSIEFQSDGTTYNPLLTRATAQASTSGTSINFTGIPSWVKRITVMFSGVSTTGTSDLIIQIGSGSVTTTGYNSSASRNATAGGVGGVTSTSGFIVTGGAVTAALVYYGAIQISNISGNTWVSQGVLSSGTNYTIMAAGNGSLSSNLDRVRITTVNGTDTFDAGTINIMYE